MKIVVHGISLKSFIVGNILSWVFLFASLFVLFCSAVVARPSGVTFDQGLQQLFSSPLVMSLAVVSVILSLALAGYIAAAIARRNLLLNGALAAASMIAYKAYLLTRPAVHEPAFHGITLSLLGWGVPLFALSGAYLEKLRCAGGTNTTIVASQESMSSTWFGQAFRVSGKAILRRWKWILAIGVAFTLGFVAGGFLLTVAIMEREFFVSCPAVFTVADAAGYAPVRGPGVFPPRVLSHPTDMPRAAILARVRGTVSLLLRIEADGHVSQAHLVNSSGFCPFDIEAIKDVNLWRFAPAYRLGTPVATWFLVHINFGGPNSTPQVHVPRSGIDT
jgi:TonB family protein